MALQYDKSLIVSTAGSRWAARWKKQALLWSEFVERCKIPTRSKETLAEYMALKKSEQDELKDVGGFVGGALRGGIRNARNVIGRDMIALDLDSIPPNETDTVLSKVDRLGVAALVYSTRKHTQDRPRLRVLLPLAQTISAEEYEPVARKLAQQIGLEYADKTTFDVTRLMYWPSCSADSQFVFKVFDKPFTQGRKVLGLYSDWHDVSQWPTCPGEDKARQHAGATKQDPRDRDGVLGAFCRAYDIEAAMDAFLPGVYVPAGEGRYTYTGGSTTGGAILYQDGLFMYSHHATDPCSGQLVNSYDLVRLHKFSDKDQTALTGTPINRLPSSRAMQEFALSDSKVKAEMAKATAARAKEAFSEDSESEDSPEENWTKKLSRNDNGQIKNTIDNAVLVLKNDPHFVGTFGLDEFSNRGVVIGQLPWDKAYQKGKRRNWSDTDDANMRRMMEKAYGITARDKIDDALMIVAKENAFHEVRAYLSGLKWDGKERLGRLFIDYLGAEDTPYVRAVARTAFTAAVARIMSPGVKYDYMPILYGPQGIGKSTLLATMAGPDWFSDSLQTFQGKEAAEMLQGVWINEIGELYAMSFSDTNAVKQFLSKRDDVYREAYGRRTNRYPRQCVFFGTSNKSEFLKDRTGNRRFWPIECTANATKSIWDDLPKERDQLWAEAVVYNILGAPLYLKGKLEDEAKLAQEAHRESNPKEGVVLEFIEREVPVDWNNYSISDRRAYWGNGFITDGIETVPREKVCALEVWCECFGGTTKNMQWRDSQEINEILASAEGWQRSKHPRRFGADYGRQRGYERQPKTREEKVRYDSKTDQK
jgi:putative DNA primase/helicase